jgi:hypothetical protein
MILDQHGTPGDARALTQQRARVFRMVQHIHEQDHIDPLIRIRQDAPVKRLDGDRGGRPHQDIHAFYLEIRAKRVDGDRHPPIPSPNVEHPQAGCRIDRGRQEFGEMSRQDPEAAGENQLFMGMVQQPTGPEQEMAPA